MVYGRLARKKGIDAMREAFWKRALKVYACHAAMLLFLFTVIGGLGLRIDQPAVTNLMAFYLAEPTAALLTSLLLIYAPPLLDILPMYIIFMLASPWVLAHGLRHGWGAIMTVSVGMWLLAQFGLGEWIHRAAVMLVGLPVPFKETGSFATFAWQFLWVMGLWMGASRTGKLVQPFKFPPWAVVTSIILASVGLAWRHWQGQLPFPDANNVWNLPFDKWQLGPLRLINLFVLMIVVMHFSPLLKRRLPRMRWLEKLGAASLPVFCAHLVVVLLVLALFGADPKLRPVWLDALLLIGCFAVLIMVARITLRLDRRQGLKAGASVGTLSRRADAPRGAPEPPQAPANARQ
jgi:hypothetical protein